MPIEAVIFDWGGTLADYAQVELEDMWRLAARHIAPMPLAISGMRPAFTSCTNDEK